MADWNRMGMGKPPWLGNGFRQGTIGSDPAGVGKNNANNTIPNLVTSNSTRLSNDSLAK